MIIEILLLFAGVILIGVGAEEAYSKNKNKTKITGDELTKFFKNRGITNSKTTEIVAYNEEKTDFTPPDYVFFMCGAYFILIVVLSHWVKEFKANFKANQARAWIASVSGLATIIFISYSTRWHSAYINYYPSVEDLAKMKEDKELVDTIDKDNENRSLDYAKNNNNNNPLDNITTTNQSDKTAVYKLQDGTRTLNREAKVWGMLAGGMITALIFCISLGISSL
jgi:hypothetical protein